MNSLSADQIKLGFIGLGNMGSLMARRLLDHGYPLIAYDRNIAKAEVVAAERGFVAKSMLELARTADVILSCLTNDEAVQSVYTGTEGVFCMRTGRNCRARNEHDLSRKLARTSQAGRETRD